MTDETGKPKLVGTGVQKGLLRNDQTKTPERIWAYAGTFKMWRDHKTDAPHTQTEYIRADISNAKDKRIAELEADLADCAAWVNAALTVSPNIDLDIEAHARTTLAELKETTK